MELTNKKTHEIISFIKEHGPLYENINEEEWEKIIELHQKYGTFMVLYDSSLNKNIIAIARWNLLTESMAHVLDVVIHSKFRKLTILKNLVALAVNGDPNIKEIIFSREKYPEKKGIKYSVKRFLKRRNCHGK